MPGWAVVALVLFALTAFITALATGIRWSAVRLGRRWTALVVAAFLALLVVSPVELPVAISVAAGLAPMLLAAFAIPDRVMRPVTIASMTVAAIAGVVVFVILVPMHHGYSTRAKMSEVALAMSTGRTAVIEFHARHKRLPKDPKELGDALDPQTKWVRSISYSGGELRAVVAIREIDGKTLVLKAEAEGEGLKWTCYSPDIPPRHLPLACR